MNEQQYVETLLSTIDSLNFDLLAEQRKSSTLQKENRSLKKVVRDYKESNQKYRYHNKKKGVRYGYKK